ncbi:MAG: hypothetical protein IKS88_00875, partial [Clostridia bacterium]|nr:hypothetical protein [Clostridia bacterium]
MKKLLSFMLAMMFALTAFGVATVFSGFIGAGALYDYYIYDKLPGYSIFTDEELAKMTNLFTAPGYNETIEGVGPVVTYEFTKGNEWRHFSIYNGQGRNMKSSSNSLGNNFADMTWASIDTVGNKTFVGTLDSPAVNMADEDGLAFCVYVNGQPFTGNVGITVMQYPTKGPYFTMTLDDDTGDHTAEELAEYGIGFRYSSKSNPTDANGYVHFDFKTDFRQSDWWSSDDEGVNMWKKYKDNGQEIPYMPLPEKVIPRITGLNISFNGVSVGDKISIGDMMAYHDSRVHTDELEELMEQFDALDPNAYTEDSYEAATEVYLEAYNIINDDDVGLHYTQKQINSVAKGLKAAIKELKPMFMRKSETVVINGFDSLTDDDIDAVNDGGYNFDAAMLDEDVIPDPTVKQSIAIIGGAFAGDPSYGWSLFSTAALDDDDEIVAVGNVFGADNLDEAAGLRFWIKYGAGYEIPPTDAIVGIGSSTEGVYFECDPAFVQLPESEGYVGIAWSAFYDMDGTEEVFDYLNSLDYFVIRIENCTQCEYYISDLHAFEWSIHSANFTEMDKEIVDTQNYLASLNKDDWSVRSWERVEEAIEAARKLHDTYATTQQDVDAATEWIRTCVRRLTPRGDTPTKEELDALEAAYASAQTYWHGNYTGRSYAGMKAVMDEVGGYINDEMGSEVCRELTTRMNDAVAALVPVTHRGEVAPTAAIDANGNEISVKLFSFEDFENNLDLERANGHRRDYVSYDVVTESTSVDLPAKALRMVAQKDLSSKVTDQHGALQFKLFDKFGNSLTPDVEKKEDGNTIGGAIGDLSGSAGIRIWIGVNDVALARDAYFRVGVSNCTEGPLFEKHATDIPFPASGSGWIYIPWEYFDYYDEWTKGVDINLAEIRFWIIRVDGIVPKGLEVYATCISVYTDPAPTENAVPSIVGANVIDRPVESGFEAASVGEYLLTVDNQVSESVTKSTTVKFKTVEPAAGTAPVVY